MRNKKSELTLKALTNSSNGKLLSGDGSGISARPSLPRNWCFGAVPSYFWCSSQNSLFLRTIFLRSSKVMTTG